MNAQRMLRFKIVTSVLIAALGGIMLARLAAVEPLSLQTVLPFLIAAVFIIAGLWRAQIYFHALRGLAKP